MAGCPYMHTEISVDGVSETIDLNLPRDITKIVNRVALSNKDLTQPCALVKDTDHEVLFGGFFNSKEESTGVSMYSYHVVRLNDDYGSTVFTVSPIQVNNVSDPKVYSLNFQLPADVFNGCISINEADSHLVIDVILTNNLIISFNLALECFFKYDHFSIDNFYDWCNYSIPYSFDQRIPVMTKSLESNNVIVSTCDGGLLSMCRFSFNAEFNIVPLTSTSYLNSIKARIFGKSLNDGKQIEFNDLSVSTESVVDIVSLTSDIFVTVSVNKKLTFWSLITKSILKEIQLNDYLNEIYHSAILSPSSPKTIMKILDNGLLSIFLPFHESSVFIFKINTTSLLPELVYKVTPPKLEKQWNPIEYCIYDNNGLMRIWFCWAFGELSFYQSCKLSIDEGKMEWSKTIEFSKFQTIRNTQFMNQVKTIEDTQLLNQYASRFILSQYNSNIIGIALDLLKYKSTEASILDKLLGVIKLNSKSLSDFKNEWIKFASICQDIQNKTSHKIFSISIDTTDKYINDPFVFVLNGLNKYTLIKKTTIFEELHFNSMEQIDILPEDPIEGIETKELMKLVDLIFDYCKGYDEKMLVSILNDMVNFGNGDDIATLMNTIFDKYIIKVANETVVAELLNILSSIKNVEDLMNYLSLLLTTNFAEYKSLFECLYTNTSESILINSISSNNLAAKKIILGLMLILSTVDISEPVIKLFSKLHENLRYITLLDDVLNLPTKTLIIDYLKRSNNCAHIKNTTLNFTVVNLLNKLFSHEFAYFVVSNLISSNDLVCAKEFGKYLLHDSPLTIVLQTLLKLESGFAEEAKLAFTENFQMITSYSNQLTAEEKQSVDCLRSPVAMVFVQSSVDYFYNLSILFESKEKYLQALDLALKSSKQILEQGKIGSAKETDVFYKIFELSLRLKQYEMSFSAIKHMSHNNRIIPIRKFIYKLLQENEYKKITQFNYAEDFDLVDSLIYDMGEESLTSFTSTGDIKLALKYYKIVYSLRMKSGDLRGALQALYRFNTVVLLRNHNAHENQEVSSILKSNYSVIINLMRSLESDDRWCLKTRLEGYTDSDCVVTVDELELEYEKFSNDLEHEQPGMYLM